MNTVRSMFAGAALLALPAEAQEHRFEDDPVVMVRENFVACDVLSQLQRVMENPRFLLSGECDPVRAGDRVRVYARRGPPLAAAEMVSSRGDCGVGATPELN